MVPVWCPSLVSIPSPAIVYNAPFALASKDRVVLLWLRESKRSPVEPAHPSEAPNAVLVRRYATIAASRCTVAEWPPLLTSRSWGSTRLSSTALVATVIEEALMASAAMAGLSRIPSG